MAALIRETWTSMLRSKASSDSPRTRSISCSRLSTRPALSASAQSRSNWWPVSERSSPSTKHPPRRAVDDEPAEAQRLASRGPAAGGAAAQDGAQAGQQLARVEGLGQVVVGADFEAHDAVGLLAPCRQHQDRHVGAGANRPAELEAVAIGQHEVQDHRVVAALKGGRETGLGALPMLEGQAGAAEIGRDHLGERAVILDHQQVGHGGPTSTGVRQAFSPLYRSGRSIRRRTSVFSTKW